MTVTSRRAAPAGSPARRLLAAVLGCEAIVIALAIPVAVAVLDVPGATAGDARKGARRAWVPEARGFADVPVFDRYRLAAGVTLSGPAIVEERESTVVLGAGTWARVDEWGNLVADVGR